MWDHLPAVILLYYGHMTMACLQYINTLSNGQKQEKYLYQKQLDNNLYFDFELCEDEKKYILILFLSTQQLAKWWLQSKSRVVFENIYNCLVFWWCNGNGLMDQRMNNDKFCKLINIEFELNMLGLGLTLLYISAPPKTNKKIFLHFWAKNNLFLYTWRAICPFDPPEWFLETYSTSSTSER